MRFVKFFLALAVTVAFCWAMHHPLSVGSGIPALGKLLNPYTGFWQNADAVDATPDLELPGLTGSVQVAFDDRRVPHVFAENDLDLARAQGYLTARDRYWQMDFSARAASGSWTVLHQRTVRASGSTRSPPTSPWPTIRGGSAVPRVRT